MVPLLASVNFVSDWSGTMGALQSAPGVTQILLILTYVGVIIVVLALLRWLWDIRKAGSFRGTGTHHKLFLSMMVGALLAAPTLVIPAFLTLLDLFTNAIIGIVQHI